MDPVTLFLGGSMAVAGIFWAGNFFGQRREKALREWAAGHGFQVTGKESLPSAGAVSLSLFERGTSPAYRTVMRSLEEGVEGHLFDFTYVVSSGKNAQTVWQTVCAYRIPGWNLPALSMDPENFLHKLGSHFGYQDIDFTESPKFSGNYLLRGKDEGAIRDALGVALLDYFGANKGWSMDCAGDWLFLYKREGLFGRISTKRLKAYYDETRRILGYFLEGRPGDGD